MVDPLQVLPNDLIIDLFSLLLLSTPNLALTSATNKLWRDKLLTDPYINKIIDLTQLQQELSAEETIQLISRLASNSTSEYSKVAKELHLNVDSFVEKLREAPDFQESGLRQMSFDYLRGKEDDSKSPYSEWFKLLNVMSSSTRGQLTKAFFRSSDLIRLDYDDGFIGDLLLDTALILDDQNEALREIHWVIPYFPISVESRDTAKVFSVENPDEYIAEVAMFQCHEFIRDVTNFTGVGLMKLKLDLTRFWDLQSISEEELPTTHRNLLEFFEEVLNSEESLRELSVTFNRFNFPESVFSDLVTKLSSLSSLRIDLVTEVLDDELVDDEDYKFSISPTLPPFKLKNFTFKSERHGIDQMEWLVGFAGSTLESLNLCLPFDSALWRVSADILISILKVNSSLKHLTLENLTIVHNPTSASMPAISLPNLESISIKGAKLPGYGILSRCFIPSLKRLELSLTPFPFTTDDRAEYSFTGHFDALLDACCSSLVEIKLDGNLKGPYGRDRVLIFPKLQILSISSNQSALDMFSHFNLHRLKVLHLEAKNNPCKPKFFYSLLVLSSEHLEDIKLCGMETDLSEAETYSGFQEFQEFQEFLALTRSSVKFPNVHSLEINSLSASLVRLLLNSTYPKISSISLGSTKMGFHHALVFLQNHSSTLVSLDVKDTEFIPGKIGSHYANNHASFPELSSISVDPERNWTFLASLIGLDRSEIKHFEHQPNLLLVKEKLERIAPQLKVTNFI